MVTVTVSEPVIFSTEALSSVQAPSKGSDCAYREVIPTKDKCKKEFAIVMDKIFHFD
jgi:hypothetical protein